MPVRMPRPSLPLLGLALGLLACAPAGERSASRAELARALERAQRVEIWLPEGAARDDGSLLARRVDLAARTLAERHGLEVAVLERGEDGDPRAPRVELVVGELDGATLEPLGEAVLPNDVLLSCLEDDERPGLPRTVLAAGRPRLLTGLLDDLAPRHECWLARLRHDHHLPH